MTRLVARYIRLPVILILLALMLLAITSLTRRWWYYNEGAMITAFGEDTGRSVPGIVEYYDKAATVLEQYLKSEGFSLMNHPPGVYERGSLSGKWAGFHSVAEREKYYKNSYHGSPEIYVILRQPTENAAGLDVYVYWSAEGTPGYIHSVKGRANDCWKQLAEWWHHYQEENRRPTGIMNIE